MSGCSNNGLLPFPFRDTPDTYGTYYCGSLYYLVDCKWAYIYERGLDRSSLSLRAFLSAIFSPVITASDGVKF